MPNKFQLAIAVFVWAFAPSAHAQLPRNIEFYSRLVANITKGKKITKNAVYVAAYVLHPGAYEFKDGMTVASLVEQAGGLIGYPYRGHPELQSYPTAIGVMRPSKSDPDPAKYVYVCSLDAPGPITGLQFCRFKLKKGDLLDLYEGFPQEGYRKGYFFSHANIRSSRRALVGGTIARSGVLPRYAE